MAVARIDLEAVHLEYVHLVVAHLDMADYPRFANLAVQETLAHKARLRLAQCSLAHTLACNHS